MKSVFALTATPNPRGNTIKALDLVCGNYEHERVELHDLKIHYFSYEKSARDDFLPLIERMCEADVLLLVTPIYWYTMSAPMKAFFDRLTDLLLWYPDLGQKLKGKKVFVVTSWGTSHPGEMFEYAFRETSNYLGMDYQGCYFYQSESLDVDVLARNESDALLFQKRIWS